MSYLFGEIQSYGHDDDLRENIRSITDLVDAKDDCITISAVHDRIDKESSERRKELEKAHANLKGTPFFLYHRAPSPGIEPCF